MGHGAFGTAAKYPPLLVPLSPPLSSVLTPSPSAPPRTRAFDFSRRRPQVRGDVFLPQPDSTGICTKWTRHHQNRLTRHYGDPKALKRRPTLRATKAGLVKLAEASQMNRTRITEEDLKLWRSQRAGARSFLHDSQSENNEEGKPLYVHVF